MFVAPTLLAVHAIDKEELLKFTNGLKIFVTGLQLISACYPVWVLGT